MTLSPFLVFAKPVGATCNLNCSYCYYLDKRELYARTQSLRMSAELLERYIAQHIEICPTPTAIFCWHGGEPTLLGVDYFRQVVALQKKHRRQGQQIINSLQSNGTLIDDEWCRFLAQERFLVGLSLDGPKELHDAYRAGKTGQPTHERVESAFRRLASHGIHSDILCVVHDRNVAHPAEVYRYFKSIGGDDIVFLPLVRQEGGAGSVAPEAFGEFLCAIFDEWIRHDMATVHIGMFEEAMRPARGLEHSLCVFRKTCGELPVLEHNGDLYSCDHFVDRDHWLGNLREVRLDDALQSPAQIRFGRDKWESLSRQCRECSVLEYCHGGCPKDRVATGARGEAIHVLCSGLRRFFRHAKPYGHKLASFLKTGKPVDQFMAAIRAGDAGVPLQPGRNDMCPCGSGRKYKKCCALREGRENPGVLKGQ